MRKLTIALAIALGVIIIVLISILIFVPPAKAPTGGKGQPQASVSADGHLAVTLPHAGDVVSSPVAIEGSVTGAGWFFEASFPIKVLDADGRVLGTGTARALSDWMTTGTVPFSASIPFVAPHFATGTIVFQNDNPSGLPENQRSLSVPIGFAK